MSHITYYGPRFLMLAYMSLSVAYLCAGDWKRALYWAGAFIITVSVTI